MFNPVVVYPSGFRVQRASQQKPFHFGGSSVPMMRGGGISAPPLTTGMDGEEALLAIKKSRPDLNAFIIPEGSMMTRDVRDDRVRIFVDKDGMVVGMPRIG